MAHSRKTRTRSPRNERLALRVDGAQAKLIRSAAEAAGKSVTDFVLETASAAAEQALADRRQFVVPAKAWKRFLELLDKPTGRKPRLRRLFSEPTVLDRRK
jgi:uncharacterized protein (DUF1778 family)